jgi:hypothetical protein
MWPPSTRQDPLLKKQGEAKGSALGRQRVQAAKSGIAALEMYVYLLLKFAFRGFCIVRTVSVVLDICYCECEESA